jgi:hypothetical protein
VMSFAISSGKSASMMIARTFLPRFFSSSTPSSFCPLGPSASVEHRWTQQQSSRAAAARMNSLHVKPGATGQHGTLDLVLDARLLEEVPIGIRSHSKAVGHIHFVGRNVSAPHSQP